VSVAPKSLLLPDASPAALRAVCAAPIGEAQAIEGKRGGRWYASTVRYLIQRQPA